MGIFDAIKQTQSWNRTKVFLLKAKSFFRVNSLNQDQKQILDFFDEFIDHNELGLAYEQLDYLSETVDLPIEFWKEMLCAAKEMKLEEKITRCETFLNYE